MLFIGTRGSELAQRQARWVAERLAALGWQTELQIIRTTGDKIRDAPLGRIPGKGLFTKEIEEALLAGRIDVGVHSLKDLPTELPAGLRLAAVPPREDARDVIVGGRLADLPPGARVGTSSLRRTAQIRRLRPDLLIQPVRGNLDTRLRKLAEGHYDALVMAAAGLKRMGWEDRIAEYLPIEQVCPAPGQGALGVETRVDGEAAAACQLLEDPLSRAAVAAERAVLAALGGGCQVPIGAYAEARNGRLRLCAVVVEPQGLGLVQGEIEGALTEAIALGERLAAQLRASGAEAILRAVSRK